MKRNVLKPGDRVKMSESLKLKMRSPCHDGPHKGPWFEGQCYGCSGAHVDEFGECEGIVDGPAFPDTDEFVDVRWIPSKLRYMYEVNGLVKV